MAAIRSNGFRRDGVRIALTSGLIRCQVASGLGIGLSTLGKWIRAISGEAKVPERDGDLLRENERLRKENRISREEREVPRNGGPALRCVKTASGFWMVSGSAQPPVQVHHRQ